VYSLDSKTGCTYWGFKTDAAVRGGVTMGDVNGVPAIFAGDASATVYAINAQSGELIWKIRPVDHFTTMLTAAPQVHNGVVYQSFSSFEEALASDPSYPCFVNSGLFSTAGCRGMCFWFFQWMGSREVA
jgi:polyvinyl alcohol dehydrogenase (cytochrome)